MTVCNEFENDVNSLGECDNIVIYLIHQMEFGCKWILPVIV